MSTIRYVGCLCLILGIGGCGGVDVKEEGKKTQEDPVESLRRACLEQEGENAVPACRKVLRLRPSDYQVEHRLGWLLGQRGKIPEGIAHLRKADKLHPNDSGILCHLGMTLEKRGDRDGAMDAYRRALQADPKNTEAWLSLGVLLRKMGKKEESEKELRNLIRQDPKMATAWAQLSLTLVQQGRLKEAIEAGSKAVALKPDDANARSNLGLFLTDAGRTDEAVEELTRAVQIEPHNATAQYNLGLAYTKADAIEEAARAYLGALDQRESFPQAHHNLGVIFIGTGLCKSSRRHLERAHILHVKSSPIVMEQYKAICGTSGGYRAPNGVFIKWGTSFKDAIAKLEDSRFEKGIFKDSAAFEITDSSTFPVQEPDLGGTILEFDKQGFSKVTFGNISKTARVLETLVQMYGKSPDKKVSKLVDKCKYMIYMWFGWESDAVLTNETVKYASTPITKVTISREKYCPLKGGCD